MKEEKRKKNRGNPKPSEKAHKAASKSLLGNNFWEIRSKHGRDRLFESPELLWEAACEYFQWCVDNPLMESENRVLSNGGNTGSYIEETELPKKRVFTLQGLCLFLDCNTAYFRQFKDSKAYKEVIGFSTVIAKIEETIFHQQFEGASSGFFNANIISRALGLVDKTDHTTAGEKIEAPVFQVLRESPALSNEEKKVDQKRKKRDEK